MKTKKQKYQELVKYAAMLIFAIALPQFFRSQPFTINLFIMILMYAYLGTAWNVLGGITSFIAYKFEVTQQLSTYFVGSFSLIIKGNYELVWLAIPLVIAAFLFANYFNIVGMGREFSQNLGVNYKLVLFLGLTIASMITASVVTIVGQISYIGLIIPNIVAMFKGDKIKGTLVDTALLGALFVLICDMIARSVIMPYELPIELIVGIIGSLLFIAMLIYKLSHGRKAIRLGKVKEGSCCG